MYGQADTLPISETAPIKDAESPYGNTKQIGEEIIRDTCKVTPDLKAIALRYFNPIGAHDSGKIGELPIGTPQNLVPFITQTGAGHQTVRVSDPAPSVARQVKRLLEAQGKLNISDKDGEIRSFTSADPASMTSMLPMLLGLTGVAELIKWHEDRVIR